MNGPILLCMGTRTEIVKMSPLHRALSRSPIPVAVLHTGQQREMAWQLFDFLEMRPDRIVKLVRTNDSLAHLSALILEELYGVLLGFNPRAVIVHGHSSGALMAALAAFYRKIPVGHVEAGLRSGSMYDPFPEEKNRELIGRLARWHFAPTEQARSNLMREGIDSERIHCVGNTIVDAIRWGVRHVASLPADGASVLPEPLAALPKALSDKRLVLVTANRRENWGEGIALIARTIRQALESNPGLVIVWPVDSNPNVQPSVYAQFEGLAAEPQSRLFLCDPLAYPALLWMLQNAWLVMTDSGGLQEEAASLGVPAFVLRETTERPELIAAGGAVLVGTEPRTILDKLATVMTSEAVYRRMRQAKNPFGDGRTGQAIADILCAALGDAEAETADLEHH